jgi:hypothetical protein
MQSSPASRRREDKPMHSTEIPSTWRQRLWRSWWAPILAPILAMIVVVLVAWLVPWAAPRMPGDLSAADLARNEATAVRARAFVEALGVEPGAVVCRSTDSGSAWSHGASGGQRQDLCAVLQLAASDVYRKSL